MKISFLIVAFLISKVILSQDNNNGGSITIDGSVLNYVVEGEGKPCLVIGSSVYYPKTFSKELRKHLKMYFLVGGQEGEGVVEDVENIVKILKNNKFPRKNLYTKIVPDGTHSESFWKTEFESAILWLFSGISGLPRGLQFPFLHLRLSFYS